MKNLILISFFSLAINGFVYSQTAEEIISKAENDIKGKSAQGTIEMVINTPDYTRSLKMQSWWIGNEKALIVTKSPAKEAGNKTLKIGDEIWSYLRNTETTIKIPPSMMLQSWNGSDYTNDDLVRESNLVKDYDLKILTSEKITDDDCWKIELTPKPDAPVVWGKIYYWVRKADYLPSILQYFDEKGNMVRYMVYSDIKNFHGRKMPSKWVMYNVAKKGHSTAIIVGDMYFDIKISDKIFSYQELERGN
ncbi:MAG: outer membrane lipoprotein-sorting protein [Bacteroidetes bacterium]|nr:outer membrane lipoprotein-sorting protein [Bacteroidota bacterium]